MVTLDSLMGAFCYTLTNDCTPTNDYTPTNDEIPPRAK